MKDAATNSVATAMAIAGRASRACDVCGSQRARWYCNADNAYLCYRCDQNVHSANALALRHERVRLNSQGNISSQSPRKALVVDTSARKHSRNHTAHAAQSPPSRKRSRLSRRPNPHVSSPVDTLFKPHKASHRGSKVKSESSHEVPNFVTVNIQESSFSFTHDSATVMSMAEYCKGRAAAAAAAAMSMSVDVDTYEELSSGDSDQFLVPTGYLDDFESAAVAPVEDGSSPSEDAEDAPGYEENHHDITDAVDLRDGLELEGGSDDAYRLDFSDIVALREGDEDAFEGDYGETEGDAFEGECGDTEGDGEVEAAASNEQSCVDGFPEEQPNCVVPFTKEYLYKVKSENSVRDGFALIKKEVAAVLRCSLEGEEAKPAAPSLLRLNFDDVLSAWSDRSLWTDGKRPQTVPDDSSEAVGGLDLGLVPDLSKGCAQGQPGTGGDRGREARVLRYREKRRTRLFSKKIRYEVRKLNAERRPRMKGRFVKRTTGCS